ncbi:gluconate transporter [Leptolyngbya sp. NK1-12]|uniref:Gluconate transporter n=1 Tax=Leptolyngbya sp. NK1-12 TaxID=2547451 RepID=A0AA96WXF9_9CYAN|nr:gluconate:H+ symporter [Leptolyngbya sp. NK1-12]WNZ26112.1 gluconate transporter [Leptolyngbya sp. NK1-12]
MSTFSLLFITVLGIALLLFLVIVVRLQAFLALLIASLFVAVIGGIPPAEIADTIREGMGSTLGYIAIVIGLGAMFGELLQVSGGAEQIANTLVRKFGEINAQWALGLAGLAIATPVFFDVGLIICIPLVYSLGRRTGRSLLYYAIPLVAGLAVGHSFVPPTPGPVAVASLLGADLGWVILFGLLAGLPALAIGGVLFGKYIAKRIHLNVPAEMEEAVAESIAATSGASDIAELDSLESEKANRELIEKELSRKPLPSFGMVITIIAIPLVLILLNTVLGVILPEGNPVRNWMSFIGHPFTALTLATLLSFYFLGTLRGYSMSDILRITTKSFEPVGLIILVTGAGGVFGKVLVETGVGKALAEAMAASNLPVILLAFLIAAAVRVSQGSATVSMVTAAGLIAPVLQTGTYSAPLIGAITIAIAAGATILSHVNDSGFWLVGRYLGMSEKDTLRSWTVMETIIGFVGFAVVFVLSFFL